MSPPVCRKMASMPPALVSTAERTAPPWSIRFFPSPVCVNGDHTSRADEYLPCFFVSTPRRDLLCLALPRGRSPAIPGDDPLGS